MWNLLRHGVEKWKSRRSIVYKESHLKQFKEQFRQRLHYTVIGQAANYTNNENTLSLATLTNIIDNSFKVCRNFTLNDIVRNWDIDDSWRK